jgi:hypothetical protein
MKHTPITLRALISVSALLVSAYSFAQAAPASAAAPAATKAPGVKTVLPTEVVIKPKAKADTTKVKPLSKAKRSKAKVDQAQAEQGTPANGKRTAKQPSAKAQQNLAATFAKADVDKAGKLTKKQAFNAKMYEVDRYFFDMDTNIDGYVTLEELTRWKASPVRTAPRPRGDKLDRFVDGDGARK